MKTPKNNDGCVQFISWPGMTVDERAKLCYAMLTSPKFYHAELEVFNSNPVEFDPEYVFPRDIFTYTFDQDKGDMLPELSVIQAVAKNTPILCSASHKPDCCVTFRLVCYPDRFFKPLPAPLGLLVQFVAPMQIAEKAGIKADIIEAYNALS